MTQFQSSPDIVLLRDIIKTFHPSLSDEQLHAFKWTTRYNWITIQYSVKNYGYISIGICNHQTTGGIVYGPISKEFVDQLLRDKRIGYRIWRFVDDCLFDRESENIQNDEEMFKGRIPIPSSHEFYTYYMKD